MRTFLLDHRSRFFSVWSVCAVFLLLACFGVANAQRSSIMVRIDPRFPSGGTGSAIVELRNGSGQVLMTAVASFNGLGKGVNGPRRDVHFGDTPFGIYKYVRPVGGTADSRISPAFGTGKLYLDDDDMFGEVKDANRGTIRLHGGGSRLQDPYALDQRLLSTQGCVRMKNRDVNALIQLIKGLPQQEALQFIFMGSETYLRTLATDTTLSDKPWWNVLRRDLGIPPPPTPAEFMLAVWRVNEGPVRSAAAFQADSRLIELIKMFADDSGPQGQNAFNQLQSRTDSLAELRNSLPADDPLRPMIAFTLCYAGRDCAANIAVIDSALKKTSPFKGFYADEAQEMLNRLIEKASHEGRQDEVKDLIRKLLVAAPDADGALAEGLGVTLSLRLRDQTNSFIAALDELGATTNSITIRTTALDLIRSADLLTRNELTNINSRVQHNSAASAATKSSFMQFRQTYRVNQRDRNRF